MSVHISNHIPVDNRSGSATHECDWLSLPLMNAVEHIKTSSFYSWLSRLEKPEDFGFAARQAFFHSVTLPRLIGLMLSHLGDKDGLVYELLCEHAHEESTHHLLLVDWMLHYSIIHNQEEAIATIPTIETRNCINIAYEIAFEHDVETWLAVMNSAIELCFFEYFKVLAPKMRSLGAGHEYFDVHVEADEEHSTAGFRFLSHIEPNSAKADLLVRKSLDSVSLWTEMVHSWIGEHHTVRFDVTGSVAL